MESKVAHVAASFEVITCLTVFRLEQRRTTEDAQPGSDLGIELRHERTRTIFIVTEGINAISIVHSATQHVVHLAVTAIDTEVMAPCGL